MLSEKYIRPKDIGSSDIVLMTYAFNYGEAGYSGDLIVYDLLPLELQYKSNGQAGKYTDVRTAKALLSALPIVQFAAFGMNDYSLQQGSVSMEHDQLGSMHRYTFKGLTLNPGEGVGFATTVNYILPPGQDMHLLRKAAVGKQPVQLSSDW